MSLAACVVEWHGKRDGARGVGRGIAWMNGYGSYVAQVAEASFDAKGNRIRIHRFVCAADCGLAINPEGVMAQMESAIHWGLAAALKSEITVEHGRIVQQNFSDAAKSQAVQQSSLQRDLRSDWQKRIRRCPSGWNDVEVVKYPDSSPTRQITGLLW
jgi:hypothetical protein